MRFKTHLLDAIDTVARNELIRVIVLIVEVTIIAGFLVFMFERVGNPDQFASLSDAVWWALVTITTVGYGDKVPVTEGGRLVAAVIMFSGVVLISIFTATVSSILIARKIKEGLGLKEINWKNHILVCGWNPNTEQILQTFNRYSVKGNVQIVLVNTMPGNTMEGLLKAFDQIDVSYVHGDFTKEATLRMANVKHAAAAIILPDVSEGLHAPSDDRTLLATLTIKSIDPKVKVYAHILDRENVPHLKRAKADEVVVSDEHIGFLLANHILFPGAPQVVQELLSVGHGNDIHRIDIPTDFIGRTFEELFVHFKKSHNWILLGFVSEEANVKLSDILTHDPTAIDAFIEKKFKHAGFKVGEGSNIRVNINPPSDYRIEKSDFAIVVGSAVTSSSV
ncbi:MAG TPA: ion channel [Bacteroidota bacterium]